MRSVSKQFAEFRLGDLVTMETYTLHNSDDVIDGGHIPYVTRSTLNNGIAKFAYERDVKELAPGNAITVAGESSKLYYQPTDFIVGTKVSVLRYPEISQCTAKYLITCIEKATQAQYGFSNILTGARVVETSVTLPITDASANTDTPEPDWEYMEDYIATIEQTFIDQVAGMNTREQKILQQLYPETVDTEPEACGFEEFRVGDVFEITSGSNIPQSQMQQEGVYPVIAGITENNGIRGYVNVAGKTLRSTLTITCRGRSGVTFWHPYEFVLGNNALAVQRKEGVFTQRQAVYTATLLSKIGYGGSYSEYVTYDSLFHDIVQLPITPTGDIDWDYMEKYIAWIETRERESRKLRAAREEQILDWLHQQH